MIIDDLRDKAIETLQMLKGRLEESDLYAQAKERFDSQPPLVQRSILSVAVFFVLYLIALIPLSYYHTGSENIALYEENRDLILDLYNVKRKSASTPLSGTPLEPAEIESRARTAINAARIQADQVKGIKPFENTGPNASNDGFVPKGVQQRGVEIDLANLNVAQIVELGHALTNLSESSKMVGLEVRAGTQPGNYFDATFKVISFSMASTNSATAASTKKK